MLQDSHSLPRRSHSRGFMRGLSSPLKALAFLVRTPRVLSVVAIPVAMNCALYWFFIRWGATEVHSRIDHLVASLSGWWAPALAWLLHASAWVLLLLVAALTFSLVGGLLMAPFNDLVTGQTIRAIKKKSTEGASATDHLRVLESFTLEGRRSLILISAGFGIFLLGLLPLMQVPALAMGSWLLAFEYLGYPLSRKSTSLWTVWAFIAKHPFATLGFGASLLVLMAIPMGSLFYIPLAVVGATQLTLELNKDI